jgi:hypothetical protein
MAPGQSGDIMFNAVASQADTLMPKEQTPSQGNQSLVDAAKAEIARRKGVK